MPTGSLFERLKKSLRDVAIGEESKQEKAADKQLREAQLIEIQNALIVLTAEVIKASKQFPGHTEQFVINYFNLHFGFIHSKRRMAKLHNYLTIGPSAYTKISCSQIKALATADSVADMMKFLFDVAVDDNFLNQREIKVLHQISKYLGVSEVVFSALLNKAKDVSNPYYVLGIGEDASDKQIQAAYRKMILKYHPDKCKLPMSKESMNKKFIDIQRAYQQLSQAKIE